MRQPQTNKEDTMKPEQLQEGALCQLRMGRWDASVKMSKDKLGKEVPKEIVRAMQDLVEDRTLLKDLSNVRRSAKGLLERNSLPFPIDGIFWVPKDKISELDKAFSEFEKLYAERLETLCENIDSMKANFKRKYPTYYVKEKYPTQRQLKKKFYFYWNFFHLTMPDQKAKLLSPKLYEREKEKFQGMVKQMEEMTINLIGNHLIWRVQRLADQCESGKINSATFSSIERFLEKWDDLWKGHIDERKMKSTIILLKKQIKSASVDRLKNNDDFRQKMGAQLEKTMKRVQSIPDFTLKRNLDV